MTLKSPPVRWRGRPKDVHSRDSPAIETVLLAVVTAFALFTTPVDAQDIVRAGHVEQDRYPDPEYYRGRSPKRDPDNWALWIPRAIFYPLYVLTEFGIRRPVRGLTGFAEKEYVPEYVTKIFNPAPNFWWSPSFIADLAVLVSAGLQFRWTDALTP